MQFNPEMVPSIADEWDPEFMVRALAQMEQQGAGGAMDMTGSASYPTGAMPDTGMGFGSIFGNAPNADPRGPAPIGPVPGMSMPQAPQTSHTPGAQPRAQPQINYPMARAQGPAPKSLRDILGGR